METMTDIPEAGPPPRPMNTMRPVVDAMPGGFGGNPMSFFNMSSRPGFNPSRFRPGMDNTNGAPVLLGLGASLMVLSIALIAARMWSRARPTWRLKADDWTILAGLILAIAQYGIICASVLYGLGRRALFVSFARRRTSLRLLFISQVFWFWSLTLIKLSVALLLLRLKHTKRWRIFLISIMCIIVSAAVLQTVFQFVQCRPFSVFWDPRVFGRKNKDGSRSPVQCFETSVINGNIVAFSTLQIILDIVFSFIPMTFIRKLHVPRREKIFMCVLMGLGIFASVAAIIRTLVLQGNYSSDDVFRTNTAVALWAVVEQHFAIIAATMPTLKSFIEMTLVRISLFFYDRKTEENARAKLVALGLLDKDDVLERDEEVQIGRRPSKASTTAGAGSGPNTTTQGAKGTSDGNGDESGGGGLDAATEKEMELSFEEMMIAGAAEDGSRNAMKAREFV